MRLIKRKKGKEKKYLWVCSSVSDPSSSVKNEGSLKEVCVVGREK
jgi:hypothetical protein